MNPLANLNAVRHRLDEIEESIRTRIVPVQVGELVSMARIEAAHIQGVLDNTANTSEAARALDISRRNLHRIIKREGLRVKRERRGAYGIS